MINSLIIILVAARSSIICRVAVESSVKIVFFWFHTMFPTLTENPMSCRVVDPLTRV